MATDKEVYDAYTEVTQKNRDEVWHAFERIERFAIVMKNAPLWVALDKTKSALEDILDEVPE